MNRKDKEQVVSELRKKFVTAKAIVFTNYKGLNVEEMSGLRSMLKQSNIEYRIIKNRLAKIAAEETPVKTSKDIFAGPLGIAISYDDPVLLPKKVFDFAKQNEKFKVIKGIIEGQTCSGSDLKSISELPSREVLLSRLVGTMAAPLSNLASGLRGTISRLAYALHALKEKKAE